jgi:hypothetical protein
VCRATAFEPERAVELAFPKLPDAPAELAGGTAGIAGGEAGSPRLVVRNTGRKALRFVQIGLLARGAGGKEAAAGSLPAGLNLAPGQQENVTREGALRFSGPGGPPASLAALTGYLRLAEFAGGGMWAPPRAALRDPRLAGVVGASGEEQRLAEFDRHKGLDAVVQRLRRLR